jgi:hypothetical protein
MGVSDAGLFESAAESGLFGSVVIMVTHENRQGCGIAQIVHTNRANLSLKMAFHAMPISGQLVQMSVVYIYILLVI